MRGTDYRQVTELTRVFCEDGREFIQKSIERVWNEPFEPYTGPKPSRVQEEKERKRRQKLVAEGQAVPPPSSQAVEVDPSKLRRRVSHFVMNLPDSAIEFLDAFRGIIPESDPKLRESYTDMPMVHCHCFTREVEQDKAEADIRRVSPLVI